LKLNKKQKLYLSMFIYWAIYLTATMALFERYNIHPATVPFGVVGWATIVELPRVIAGYGVFEYARKLLKL